MIDKNKAILSYLITCPNIQNSPLYFNFTNASQDDNQVITIGNETSLNTTFIDGTVQKRYSFTVIAFRAMSNKPVVKTEGYTDNNVEEMFNVQELIDWINEQNDLRNFPNFGRLCDVESISVTTENPNLNGVDKSTTPALAKYSFTIRVDYLDRTKCIWNN